MSEYLALETRTLETALKAWLASRNPDLVPQAARLVIANRLHPNRD